MDTPPARISHDSDLVIGIVCRIRRRVAEGIWATGSLLPTRDELAELFETSPSTVQSAIRILTTERSVITRKRAGTCIATEAPEYGRFALVMSDHGTTARPGSSLFHDRLLKVASRIPKLRPGWRLDAWTADDPALHALVRSGALEGIFYVGEPQKLPRVAGTGIPLACFHYDGAPWYGDINLSSQKTDFFATCTSLLVGKGRHLIGVIDSDLHTRSSPGNLPLREPAQAIARIVHEHGGRCLPTWIQGTEVSRPVATYQAALLMLGQGVERPDALILTDDHLLPAVREAARDLALEIPSQLDLCVLGHDSREVPVDGCSRVGFDMEQVLLETLRMLALGRRGKSCDRELPCRYRDMSTSSKKSTHPT